MCIMEALAWSRVAMCVGLYELPHESPGNCCTGATLERHCGYFIWGYVMATSLLHHSYVMAVATAAASAGREALLQLLCQPGENKCVCSSYGFWVFFQPLSSCLAYSELRYQCRQCEQKDSRCYEQDKEQKRHQRNSSTFTISALWILFHESHKEV